MASTYPRGIRSDSDRAAANETTRWKHGVEELPQSLGLILSMHLIRARVVLAQDRRLGRLRVTTPRNDSG